MHKTVEKSPSVNQPFENGNDEVPYTLIHRNIQHTFTSKGENPSILNSSDFRVISVVTGYSHLNF